MLKKEIAKSDNLYQQFNRTELNNLKMQDNCNINTDRLNDRQFSKHNLKVQDDYDKLM